MLKKNYFGIAILILLVLEHQNEFTDQFTDWFVVFAYGTIIAFPKYSSWIKSNNQNSELNVEGIKGVAILAPNQQIKLSIS